MNFVAVRECSFEKCWGGGQVNSALDLGGGGGGSCKFCIRGKKPVTLHFRIIILFIK